MRRSFRYTEEQGAEGDRRDAMQGRRQRSSADDLDEDLVEWSKLTIYRRPSQYGFLTTLQEQPTQGVWSESEDPFSLFGDLVRLLQLPLGWEMEILGEGSDTTFKFLAAPTEADSSAPFYRFYVMKTLGYVPHCWDWGSGIGGDWKGFKEPDAFEATLRNQFSEMRVDETTMNDEDFHFNREFAFPECKVGNAKRLHHHIRQYCRDWRAVCCNEGSDGYTPAFFVCESTAYTHRWTGYAGGKVWTQI